MQSRFGSVLFFHIGNNLETLSAMTAFLAVADTGSVTHAALKLGKTPSAVTKAINSLEQALGLRLMTRSTRQVALTEAGRIYLETASDVINQLTTVGQRLSELDGHPRGRLHITAPLSFKTVLAGFLPFFMQRHQEVTLDISLTDRYVDLVGEAFDLALRLGHHDLPGQIARVVGSNSVLLCASPDYLTHTSTPHHPTDLAGHQCLIYRHPMLNPAWVFSRGEAIFRFEPTGRIQTDNFELLIEAACSGMGILPCPHWSVRTQLANGSLVRLMAGYSCSGEGFGLDHVYAVYPETRRNSLKVRLLIEELRGWMSNNFAPPT
ncbi:LysR family transcriptional regulator [Rhodobacteraceae bacterium CH30]|nr:LysR family transcriptional regulator [Rhodobacteraceae bacterium CH30]